MGVLAKGQEETNMGALAEVEKTQQEVQETKLEIAVFAAVQEETKQEMSETKQRLTAVEGKIGAVLALLRASSQRKHQRKWL
jgi:hypothetical protein